MARKTDPIEAYVVQRQWLRRVIQLTGRLEATLEYDARSAGIGVEPGEIIRVDGRKVRTTQAGRLYGKHSHSFRFSTRGGNASTLIEVEFAPLGLPGLAKLRLTIDDAVVYEEASGRVLQGSRTRQLPIPAEASIDPRGALPVPSTARSERPGPLPLPASEHEGRNS